MTTTLNAATTGGFTVTSDTSGILQLQTANTAALTINASQNVGIGTASPSEKLSVSGNASVNVYKLRSNTSAPASTDAFIYRPADNTLGFGTASSEKMRLDSAGNLGLGVTPSAWRSSFNVTYGERVLELTYSALVTQAGPSTILANNVYFNSSNQWIYKNAVANTNAGLYTIGSNGVHSWSVAPTGASGAVATFTQAMTLDASGYLMVGTTTSNSAKLSISNAGAEVFQFYPGVTSNNNQTLHYNRSTSTYCTNGMYAADHRFFIGGSEVSRIDSSGNLLVGTTSSVGSERLNVTQSTGNHNARIINSGSSGNIYGPLFNFSAQAPNNGTSLFLICSDNAATRAQIYSNGGIGNYSANNVNLSDKRTKTDIQDAGGYLAKICAIPVRTFKYKDQTDDLLNLGCIAQEVEAVAPELVDPSGFGETPDDGVPLKAIYQTDLQYALMKCIQEQQAIIESLKARLDAANI